MSLAVININDAGIQVAVDGDLSRTSPGYAVLDDGRLMVGESAGRNVKLLPSWTNTRFWSQLNTNPLPGGTPQIRHHADLAFAHLEDLWLPISKNVESVIFVVPGYYENDHLGLLLGMCRECQLPVRGVVDQSVAAACNLPLRATVLHLDIHLHAMTLTRLDNTGTLARKDVKTILDSGLFTLWEKWADIITAQFIQSTRFDPLHDADSEQQLFNRLPAWIAGLGSGATHTFKLTTGETERAVTVSTDSLLKACRPFYSRIVQAIRSEISGGAPASLLLSHRFGGFPDFRHSLGLISNLDIIDLTALKTIGSAMLHRDEIVGHGHAVSHVTRLHAGEVSEPAPAHGAATHILWRHRALPVGRRLPLDRDLSEGPKRSDAPVCTLYPRNNQLLLDSHGPDRVQVNGKYVTATLPLEPGDQIRVDDETLTVISVDG